GASTSCTPGRKGPGHQGRSGGWGRGEGWRSRSAEVSAAGRGAARIEPDGDGTPAWCVHRLLEHCDLPAGRWLEPCAGEGAVIRAVSEVRRDVTWSAIDLRPECESMLRRH